MFVGRNPDGTIYGLWTVRQFPGQEELPADNPEVVAFLAPTAAQIAEASRQQGIRGDPLRADLLARLKTATLAQISNYVDTNVTDLATARTMLKRIIYVISLDART